jgi:hypothetical protein
MRAPKNSKWLNSGVNASFPSWPSHDKESDGRIDVVVSNVPDLAMEYSEILRRLLLRLLSSIEDLAILE